MLDCRKIPDHIELGPGQSNCLVDCAMQLQVWAPGETESWGTGAGPISNVHDTCKYLMYSKKGVCCSRQGPPSIFRLWMKLDTIALED